MNLSLIIPAYRNLQDVMTCLNSLQATAADFRTIQWLIQDDCSPDVDFRKLIPPYAASVVRNEVNKGFSGNCNAGAARAQGDILCFVNQDIEANQYSLGWDNAIRAAFEDASVGIVAPRLLFPPDKNGVAKVQSVGGEFDANCAPVHRCIGYSNLEHWEVNIPREVGWATAAFIAIRKDLFQQVGGFDESYIGGYFEDVEICLKVRELGYKVWFTQAATFMHRVGSTGGNPRFHDNALLFRERWVLTHKIKPDTTVATVRYW